MHNVKGMTRTAAGWRSVATNSQTGRVGSSQFSQRSAIQRSKDKAAPQKESDKDKKTPKKPDQESKSKPATSKSLEELTDEELSKLTDEELEALGKADSEAQEREEIHKNLKAHIKNSIDEEYKKGTYLPIQWVDFEKLMNAFADDVYKTSIVHDYEKRKSVETTVVKAAAKLFKLPPAPGTNGWFVALMKAGGTMVYARKYETKSDTWSHSYSKAYPIKNALGANSGFEVHVHWAGDKETDMRVAASSIKDSSDRYGRPTGSVHRLELEMYRLPVEGNEKFVLLGESAKK
jgi:hypothetical protein